MISRLTRASLILIVALFANLLLAQEERVSVIANASVDVSFLSSSELRKIFSMRQASWPAGQAVAVFVMQSKTQTHEAMCKDVLEMFPYQLDRLWNKLAYSGLGEAPLVVESQQEMISRIQSTPGAIGYVSDDADPAKLSSVQVIRYE